MIKKIPFDINTAKAIVRGDLKGNIITEMGDNAVIYDFDFNRTDGTKGFAAKVETKYGSIVKVYDNNGVCDEYRCKLHIEAHDPIHFHKGDIVATEDGCIGFYRAVEYDDKGAIVRCFPYYYMGQVYFETWGGIGCKGIHLATEDERKTFFEALKKDDIERHEETH